CRQTTNITNGDVSVCTSTMPGDPLCRLCFGGRLGSVFGSAGGWLLGGVGSGCGSVLAFGAGRGSVAGAGASSCVSRRVEVAERLQEKRTPRNRGVRRSLDQNMMTLCTLRADAHHLQGRGHDTAQAHGRRDDCCLQRLPAAACRRP